MLLSEEAIALYEAFMAGCYEKAGEVDESGDDFDELLQCCSAARSMRGRRPQSIRMTLHRRRRLLGARPAHHRVGARALGADAAVTGGHAQ